MVGAFCARLGWTDLESLVTKFQQRVFFGVRPEVRKGSVLQGAPIHFACHTPACVFRLICVSLALGSLLISIFALATS